MEGLLSTGALFTTTQKCLTGSEPQPGWASVLGQSPTVKGVTFQGHCVNLAPSCGLFSYSPSITGLGGTPLPVACSICFDTIICDSWTWPRCNIAGFDEWHFTFIHLIYHLNDSQNPSWWCPTHWLLAAAGHWAGRSLFSLSISDVACHTTLVLFSIIDFFFLSTPIYLEYMRVVRVKIQSNLATGGFKVLWF